MTREEAVNWLKYSIKGVNYICPKEVYEMAIDALEQPDRNAQERYEDLCEYFKDCSDKGMGILGDRKEFKAWLERLHWHVVRCDELGRELEKLKSAQPERWDTCFSCPLSHGCPFIKGCTNDQAEQYACEIPIGCPLDKKSAQPEKPEQSESAREYCAECNHIEVCRYYPYEGCDFRSLPSAQPEKRTDKRTETHACDCISRQAAIDAARDWYEGLICGSFKGLEKRLRALPSAQPEIIRCKDCKHYGRADKRRFYRGMDCLNKHIDTIVPDRDFCSKAERRTDD